MEWTVLIGDEFEPEFLSLPKDVQDETLAMTRLAPALRPASGQAACGYAQGFEARQYEGNAL
jgi:hypothetical protein